MDRTPRSGAEHVVLLHGIARTRRHMRPLAMFLAKEGYRAHNLGYPSTRATIESVSEDLATQVGTLTADAPLVHFVGHSMGGLVARAVIRMRRPERLGRVVQLGTPNRGSEVAQFWKRFAFFRLIYGPAGLELGTDWERLDARLGPVDYELGIIAGDRSLAPISSWLIEGPDDGKVSVARTRLEGMADHRVMPVTHPFMPANRAVAREVVQFLRTGHFSPR